MALDGTAIKDTFLLIPKNPVSSTTTLDIPEAVVNGCCEDNSLKVLADTATDDEFKNDFSGVLWWFDPLITAATLTLLKWNGSDYAVVESLNNDDFGTLYDFEFFTNDAGENFIGYKINWKLVLEAHDEGSYKVRCSTLSTLAGDVDYDSQEFCLKQYQPSRAEGTVKLEYYLNGITGVIDNDEKVKDFGTINWYNSLRLPGFFGFPGTPFKTEYVQYNTGQRLYVEDEQEPEYTLKLKPVNYFIHETMRIDVMMADRILVTDYNSKNAGTFIQKAIQKASDYTPDWQKLKSKLAGVEVKFRQEFNNLKKLRD